MLRFRYILLIIIFPACVYAQDWEIGFFAGASNYQGDIAPDIVLKESHISGGLFFKRNLGSFFSAVIAVNQGEISGFDSHFDHLKIRNLSFESTITELSGQIEFNFFPFAVGLNHQNFSPYVVTGLSLYKFEPRAYFKGSDVELRALDTEAQKLNFNEKYSYYQLAVPIGGGLKFVVTERINIGLNVVFRYTFTDYLDDVSNKYYDLELLEQEYGTLSALMSDRSGELGDPIGFEDKQRGRNDTNDWYIFGGFTISFKIRNSVCYFR